MPQKPLPPPYDTVANLLVDARQSVGIGQIELAERLSIGQSAVSKVERGVQRLDMVECHRWLTAIGGPTFVEFAGAFDEQMRAQAAAAVRSPSVKSAAQTDVKRPRRSGR